MLYGIPVGIVQPENIKGLLRVVMMYLLRKIQVE